LIPGWVEALTPRSRPGGLHAGFIDTHGINLTACGCAGDTVLRYGYDTARQAARYTIGLAAVECDLIP
jgi:hypothetical protein